MRTYLIDQQIQKHKLLPRLLARTAVCCQYNWLFDFVGKVRFTFSPRRMFQINTISIVDFRWIDFTNVGQGYDVYSLLSLITSSVLFLGNDVHHVFFLGQIINDVHSFSFEVLSKGYAKNKNYVFHNGHIVEGLQTYGLSPSALVTRSGVLVIDL